jgi:hypothetical protein
MSTTDDEQGQPENALVPISPGALTKRGGDALAPRSYVEAMNELIMRLPSAVLGDETKVQIPLHHLDSFDEIGALYAPFKETCGRIFGRDDGISFNGGLSAPTLNIPIRYLDQLDEDTARQLFVALAPAVRMEMDKAGILHDLKELIGPDFHVRRGFDSGTPVYVIDQAMKPDELKGTDAERSRLRRERNYPLRHLGNVLNDALGEKLVEGAWTEWNTGMVIVKETDVERLLDHPNLPKAEAIFHDPMPHCEHYDRHRTLGGRTLKALRLRGHEDAPALPAGRVDVKALPAASTADEPYHPADDQKKPFISYLGGDEHETGMRFGI